MNGTQTTPDTRLIITKNGTDYGIYKYYSVVWDPPSKPDETPRKYIASKDGDLNKFPYIERNIKKETAPGIGFFAQKAEKNVINMDMFGKANDPKYDAHMKHYTPNNTKPTGRPPTVCDWIHWITVIEENASCKWDMLEPLQDTPSNEFWTSGLPGARFVSRRTGLIADVFKHKDFIQVYFSLYHIKGWCCNNEGLSTWGYRYSSNKNNGNFPDAMTASLRKHGFWMLE